MLSTGILLWATPPARATLLLRDVIAANDALREAGVTVVAERVPGVGHIVPQDLAGVLPAALEAVV